MIRLTKKQKTKQISIHTAVVACGEIHALFVVCDNGIPADVGGEISVFIEGKLSLVTPVESKFN